MTDAERPNAVPPEIRSLIERGLDESLDEAEVLRLQHALTTNPEARELYNDLGHLHAALVAQKQTSEFCQKVVRRELQDSPEVQRADSNAPTARLQLRDRAIDAARAFPLRTVAAVIAISLGIGCGVGIVAATLVSAPAQFLPVPWKWNVGNEVVAKIELTHDVDWQAMEYPETPTTRGIRVGEKLRIDRGWLQIAYRNGVTVILKGPAVYEVRSDNGGKLFSGRQSTVVPSGNPNFFLETATGKLQLGPGHFGIHAENSASSRRVSFFGFSGGTSGGSSAQFESTFGITSVLGAGDAVEFDDNGMATHVSLPSVEEYPDCMPRANREPFTGETIYLGNLFDDSKTASLTEAMLSDRYNAAAETIDLGIAAVQDGGLDVDVSLAEDGVLFSFSNVGGGGAKVIGLPGNDTYRALPTAIPIRTTGHLLEHDFHDGSLPRIEEGVGLSANELLTFDLRELREAGELGERAMRFVVDRAGMNDREYPLKGSMELAHANMIVVVSMEDKVLSAHLNGEEADVVEHAGVFSLDVDEERATRGLRYGDEFFAFDVPIPADARFLTLVSTQLEKEHHDHTVFSGARLELEPLPEPPASNGE